jgi:hypothetical protein
MQIRIALTLFWIASQLAVSQPITDRLSIPDAHPSQPIIGSTGTISWVSIGHQETKFGRYTIHASYNKIPSMTPAVYGADPHYTAKFIVSDENGEIAEFEGTFAGFKCVEDKPAEIVKRALQLWREDRQKEIEHLEHAESTPLPKPSPINISSGSGLTMVDESKAIKGTWNIKSAPAEESPCKCKRK